MPDLYFLDQLKSCVARLLADNFPAYADWDEGWLDGASAEDWGDILAHVTFIIARDDEHLETFRKDGDRFAGICAGFAASIERFVMSRRCKA